MRWVAQDEAPISATVTEKTEGGEPESGSLEEESESDPPPDEALDKGTDSTRNDA